MRRVLLCLAAILCLMSPALAQEDPASAARAALVELEAASERLQEAERSRDRVRALTEAVQAYEAGLEAVRVSLRQVALREVALLAAQKYREEELADLIGMLIRVEAAPPALHLLHPEGPVGAARSAMLLAEVTPALKARADDLRAQISDLRALRQVQEDVETALQASMAEAQRARAALSQAVADRVDLPTRFASDPDRMAQLAATAASLDAFAQTLDTLPADAALPGPELKRTGDLPLPTAGTVLRGFNEADAAGIARPGMILATRPAALVTSPVPATLRYMGPLLDLGSVVILEPGADKMIILSGLDTVFGTVGQVLPEGAPVGLMGGAGAEIGAIVSPDSEGALTARPETLYIEVRENGQPVDPETWFETGKDG